MFVFFYISAYLILYISRIQRYYLAVLLDFSFAQICSYMYFFFWGMLLLVKLLQVGNSNFTNNNILDSSKPFQNGQNYTNNKYNILLMCFLIKYLHSNIFSFKVNIFSSINSAPQPTSLKIYLYYRDGGPLSLLPSFYCRFPTSGGDKQSLVGGSVFVSLLTCEWQM